MRIRAALLTLLIAVAPMPLTAQRFTSQAMDPRVLEAAVLERSNAARERAGLRLLTADEALDQAARDHAAELARRNTLDHNSIDPTRATLEQRIELVGITQFRMIAENLAFAQNPGAPLDEVIVEMWLDSPGHRENLLERRFDRAGTGAARSANGTWYVVQLYASAIRKR